jgi:hypothetical protein
LPFKSYSLRYIIYPKIQDKFRTIEKPVRVVRCLVRCPKVLTGLISHESFLGQVKKIIYNSLASNQGKSLKLTKKKEEKTMGRLISGRKD